MFKFFSQDKFCFYEYLQFLLAFVPIVLRHILKAIWKSTRLSRHLYMFFFFIHSEASISVLEKMLLEVLEHSISIYSFNKNVGKLSIKILVLESIIRVHLYTIHLQRFVSILDMQKKPSLRQFRRVRRSMHAIACLIWWSLD